MEDVWDTIQSIPDDLLHGNSPLRQYELMHWAFHGFDGCKDEENEMIRRVTQQCHNGTGAIGEKMVLDVLNCVLPDDTILTTQSPHTIPTWVGGEENVRLDIETLDFIVEVKCCNYKTSGTANEKLLGAGMNREDVIEYLDKDLVVVCVSGAEEYARNKGLHLQRWDVHRSMWVMFTDLVCEAILGGPYESLRELVEKCR